MHFQIKIAVNGQPYVLIVGENNEPIAVTETYADVRNAWHAIELIQTQAAGATIHPINQGGPFLPPLPPIQGLLDPDPMVKKGPYHPPLFRM